MKLIENVNNLKKLLPEIIFLYHLKIPSLYKVSEVYLDQAHPTRKFESELFIRRSLGFLRAFFVTLINSAFEKDKVKKHNADIILVSKEVKNYSGKNFFFGELGDKLKDLDILVLDLRIDSESFLPNKFNTKKRGSLNICVLPRLNSKECLMIVKELVQTFILLRTEIKNQTDIEKKKLLELIRNRIFSKTNYFNFYLAIQLDLFLQNNNFNKAIVTFDGSPWERIFCRKFKKYSAFGKISFYQHAPITENSYSLFNENLPSLTPDQILCSGSIPQDIFKKNSSYKKNVSVLGSRKNLDNSVKDNIDKSDSLIFITQGSKKEIRMLYKLALKVSYRNKNLNTKVLLHPAVSLGIYLNACNFIMKYFVKNFKCISSPPDDVFIKSKYMIYFSSSLSIEKIPYGIRPIYLKNPDLENPLDLLVNKLEPNLSWCTQAEKYQDIIKIINQKEGSISFQGKFSKQHAIEFSKGYFEPFDLTKGLMKLQ